METRAPVTLLEELKRRRLVRPVVGYGVTAFAVLQVIEPIMHGLHWSDAVLTWTVIGLGCGLPLTVAFAWVFGAHESADADRRQRAGLRHWLARNPVLALLATLVFLLCAVVAVQAMRQLSEARRALSRSYLEQARQAQRDYRWRDARHWFEAALQADPNPAARFEAAIDWTELNPFERLEAHAQWGTSVVWSPDGRHLATGSFGGTVSLRDPATLDEVRRFEVGEAQIIGALAFSPDSRMLVSGHEFKNLWAWDVDSGRVAAHLETPESPASFSFSPDGTLLLAGTVKGEVLLYDVVGGGLRERPGRAIGRTVSFAPDGKRFATGFAPGQTTDGVLRLYDVADLEHGVVLGSGLKGFSNPRFLPDGTMMSASKGVAVHWDVGARKEIARIEEGTSALVTAAIATSHDGRTLAIAGTDRAWIFDIASRRQLASMQLPALGFDVAFGPGDGEVLLATRSTALLRWRWRPRIVTPPDRHSVRFVPGTHSIVYTSDSGAQLFDADSGHELARSPASAFWIAAAEGNPARIAVVRGDDAIDVLRPSDLSTEVRMVDAFDDHPGRQRLRMTEPRTTAALSPDGTRLFYAREGELVALEIPTRRQLWHAAAPWRDWFFLQDLPLPDRLLIHAKEALFLYDAKTGRQIAALPAPYPTCAFSAGKLLVGLPLGKTLVVDPATGAIEREIPPQGSAAAWMFGHPQAPLLVVGGLEGLTRIWDTTAWTPLFQQAAPANDFARLFGFSSDGRMLLFSERSQDGFGVIRFGDPSPLGLRAQ